MREFRILHLDIIQNESSPLREVGIVEAKNFEHAFFRSQNIADNWNQELLCRSTSIGDYIEDIEKEEIQQVTDFGFRIVKEALTIISSNYESG